MSRYKRHPAQPDEWHIQAQIFKWRDLQVSAMPKLAMLFCIPNGLYRKGMRPEPGMAPGIPDMQLAVARRGFHGLFGELKKPPVVIDGIVKANSGGKVKANQAEWSDALTAEGYLSQVWIGFDDAVDNIRWYLDF